MTLCINQSGTWRNITTLCVNQSGTWRNINLGCINDSGTWRLFLPSLIVRASLGNSIEGGRLICRASNVAWIAAPSSSEVSRDWYSRNDAVTTAQQVSGVSGWFIPTACQLQNPGHTCRTYWDFRHNDRYWSNTERNSAAGCTVHVRPGHSTYVLKPCMCCVRAFRCVTY